MLTIMIILMLIIVLITLLFPINTYFFLQLFFLYY
jgi:hypothetical protein